MFCIDRDAVLLRHTLTVSAAGVIRVSVDDNVLLVCDIAAGAASAFDIDENAAPGEMLRPLVTVRLIAAAATSQVNLHAAVSTATQRQRSGRRALFSMLARTQPDGHR